MEIVIKEHSELSENLLLEIIEIKKVAWTYTTEQHLKWIKENLEEDDLHILLFSSDELIGYSNLVRVESEVDSCISTIQFYGLGNVCTKYVGKGHGRLLLEGINDLLIKRKEHGVLFCKVDLVCFYEKVGWNVVNNVYPNDEVYTMVYNFKGNLVNYKDRLF
ncbi:hypothetical protein AS361_05700 [Myroides marinus]|uniref:GNAT family N-acetyltransferase n=1 Tax=Myroides marinus TaxID=703342 RepID=UPI0007422093|nr:GNAT family N-acetyltransferase [Myroides marinus]KUF42857.1 hypothetical protein AS361_05700 [Myroides marinus]